MQIDFSRLNRNAYGELDPPTLILKKPHGETIGVLGHAFGLNLELKYSDLSTATFLYPRQVDGVETPYYDLLVGDKLVDISPIGVFAVYEPESSDDGVRSVKEVNLRSLEYELACKQVVFGEGTYNLWNPADQGNSLLGMIATDCPAWKIGYVSPTLIGRYRTFGDTDSKVLDFLRNTVQESYGCVFDFDTYTRTINAYDAEETPQILPVYFAYDNLIKEGAVRELDNSLITKLYVAGADGVDIRNVNPTGDNYIYNLDYYVENGDLPDALAQRWIDWQNQLFAAQQAYTAQVSLRNAATSRKITETARLSDLRGELATLDNARMSFLQMQMNVTKGSETWQYFADRLADTAAEYTKVQTKIATVQTGLTGIDGEIAGYAASIAATNAALKYANFFTEAERDILEHYLKQDSLEDETFAVFDVDVSGNDSFRSQEESLLELSGVTWRDIPGTSDHRMAAITGGKLAIVAQEYALSAEIVSGTIDHLDETVTASFFLGPGLLNGEAFTSGNLSCVLESDYDDDAILNGMTKHADTMTSEDGSVSHTVFFYTGDADIHSGSSAFYMTRNVTEYQRYSVEKELYDYAVQHHKEIARPTFEFDIKSGNIVLAKEFEPFREALRLGCGCYVHLNEHTLLTPLLIEIHLSFAEPDSFELVFANQFRRPDKVNTMKDILSEAEAASRTLDLSQFNFGQNNNTTTWVQRLIQSGFDTAISQIRAGQSMVTIDDAGIRVAGADGIDVIHLGNGLIALEDTRTNTVSMAMGHFLNPATGTDYVGVLADIIGGTLLAGQNLIIECPNPNGGVMQFKVDSSGVILNNGRMYMRTESGAMGWDANHGFFAGAANLFDTTDEGFVRPACVDEDGNLVLDDDGFPVDTNVWIGIDGKVYVRGNIYAENGYFNGVVRAQDFQDPSGNSMLTNDGKIDADYLDLMGINVVNSSGDTVLTIDENGLRFNASYSPIKYQYSTNNSSWHDTMTSNDKYRRESYDGGLTWGPGYQYKGTDGSDANVPSYITATGITKTEIWSPSIYANQFNVWPTKPEDASYTDVSYDGSFNIYGRFYPDGPNGDLLHILSIAYTSSRGDTSPDVTFSSPCGGYANWSFGASTFSGTSLSIDTRDVAFRGNNVDFSSTTTTGLYLRFT